MPHVRLTDIAIVKLPQQKAQITYWDETLPAFGVRVGARRKTFIVVMNGGRRIKLGNTRLRASKTPGGKRTRGSGIPAVRPRR
jgi:hypothetical protein